MKESVVHSSKLFYYSFWILKQEEVISDIEKLRKYLLPITFLSMKVTCRVKSVAVNQAWPAVAYGEIHMAWVGIFGFSDFSINFYFFSLGRNWNIWSWRQQMAFCLLSHVKQDGWYMSLIQLLLFWTNHNLNGLAAHFMIRCTQMMWINFVNSFPLQKMPWQGVSWI